MKYYELTEHELGKVQDGGDGGMSDPNSRVNVEDAAWDWLEAMVEGICDEHVSDLAYSADQMVDAFVAGRITRSRDAEIAELVEVLESSPIIGDSEPATVFRSRQDRWLRNTYNQALAKHRQSQENERG